jgi:hypothetical protein
MINGSAEGSRISFPYTWKLDDYPEVAAVSGGDGRLTNDQQKCKFFNKVAGRFFINTI